MGAFFFKIMPLNGFVSGALGSVTTPHNYSEEPDLFGDNPDYDYWANQDYGLFDQWFDPNYVNRILYARQMSQVQYQNAYDNPVNDMARKIAAGISAYAAAAGIAGAASQSASPSQIPQNQGLTPGEILEPAAAIANAATGGLANTALLGVQKLNIAADTTAKLEAAGLTHWNAVSIATTLPLMEDNMRADFYLKLGQIDKTRQEYNNLVAEHENILAQYDQIIANTNLTYSQMEVNQAIVDRTAEQTRFQKATNDFFDAHGYDRSSPPHVALMNSIVDGNQDQAELIGQAIEENSSIQAEAEAAASWNRRPTNAYEASAYIGTQLGNSLKEFIKGKSPSGFLNKLKNNAVAAAEFEEAYDDAHAELYNTYREARREYRSAKYSSASESYKYQCKTKMENAKAEYDSFTREKFSEILVNQLNGEIKAE